MLNETRKREEQGKQKQLNAVSSALACTARSLKAFKQVAKTEAPSSQATLAATEAEDTLPVEMPPPPPPVAPAEPPLAADEADDPAELPPPCPAAPAEPPAGHSQ